MSASTGGGPPSEQADSSGACPPVSPDSPVRRPSQTTVTEATRQEPEDLDEGGVRRGMILSLIAGMVLSIVIYGMWHVLEVSYRSKAGALLKADDDSATDATRVRPQSTPSQAPSALCTSPNCEQFSSIFQDALSYDVDPCSDFYKFVCKRWRAQRPHEFTVRTEHRHRIVALMRSVLEAVPHSRTSRVSEVKAASLYKVCMKPIRDVEFLKEFVRVEDVSFSDEPGEHPLKLMIHLNVRYGLETLFHIRRGPTAACTGNWTFVFEKIDVHSYAPFLGDLTSSAHVIRKAYALVTGKNVTEEVLSDIFRVDAYVLSLYHRLPWLPLSRAFPLGKGGRFAGNVTVADVFLYLGNALSAQFEVEDCIVVTSVHIIGFLEQILTNYSNNQLNRYVRWAALRRVATIAEPSLLDVEELRHLFCYSMLERMLHYALSRRFLEGVVAPGGYAVREASDMISAILRSVLIFVDGSSWMSAAQKLSIHMELTKTARIMGFPRSRDIECLQGYNANTSHPSTLSAWATAARAIRACQLNSSLPSEPLVCPMSTEVTFSAEDHTLSVPAAMMIPPFFGSQGLPGINYGALGLAVSSALVGLLDLYMSRERSYTGTADDEGGLGIRLGCLKKAYKQEMGARFAMLNKMAALRDFVGLFPAYRAFVSTASAQSLQGLEWLSEEQLFFVAFCYQQCENTGVMGSTVMEPVASFRCNVPLRYMPQFADAFNCSSGSPMVSREPCYFWEASAPARAV